MSVSVVSWLTTLYLITNRVTSLGMGSSPCRHSCLYFLLNSGALQNSLCFINSALIITVALLQLNRGCSSLPRAQRHITLYISDLSDFFFFFLYRFCISGIIIISFFPTISSFLTHPFILPHSLSNSGLFSLIVVICLSIYIFLLFLYMFRD